MVSYSSAVFTFDSGDSIRYARLPVGSFHPGLLSDSLAPAGYPVFLKVLRAIWSALAFTVAVQHLIGILTALVLYALARRLGASRGVALIPAGVVLLSGDQLFLEHALLSETLWTLLVSCALYALVRGSDRDQPDVRWLVAAGLLLGGAALVRQLSLALLPIAAVWIAVVVRGGGARRAWSALTVLSSALVLLGLYVGIASLAHGYTGLNDDGGFELYGRVAEFADCTKFKPPGRTRVLCQTIPPARRSGATKYLFGTGMPLERLFHVQLPRDSPLLGQFAIAAIEHQPGAYLSAVVEDWERAAGLRQERIGEGANPAALRFDWGRAYVYGGPSATSTVRSVAAEYRTAYTSVRALPLAGWASRLGGYQAIIRVHEQLVIPLVMIALFGAIASSGLARSRILLTLFFALALYMAPALVVVWDARFGVLPGELLALAASAGAWQLWLRQGRLGVRRSARPAAPREADGLRGSQSAR
jgi:membrane protein implicated in regulation of membrane protease activity